jgi:peptidoglycan/LPS O-acetylase OafA/YrhL
LAPIAYQRLCHRRRIASKDPGLRSFENRLAEVGGFGPGFDLVRLVLCYEVLVWHCWVIGEGSLVPGKSSLAWIPFELMVPMFFALSGFLVAGSSLRLAPPAFLINRALRIFPALWAAVFMAALVVGPIMTELPLGEYFREQQFRAYFLNLFGIIRYPLPGVFGGTGVNGSLWTVPWEIGCYFIMVGMVLVGLPKHGGAYLAVALAILLAGVGYAAMGVPAEPQGLGSKLLKFALTTQGGMLIPYFLSGAALFHLRGRIPWDWRIAAACVVVLVCASLFVDGLVWSKTPLLALLALVPSVYLVPYFGLLRLPRPPGFRKGDYSYGVYVCHYPIVMTLHTVFGFGDWRLLLLASFVPVTLFAMASWHWIEAPILAHRKRFSMVGRRIAEAEKRGA